MGSNKSGKFLLWDLWKLFNMTLVIMKYQDRPGIGSVSQKFFTRNFSIVGLHTSLVSVDYII